MLRHGSLFSGIGGFDIAAAWMGWQNIFSCERNPFCQTILQHYWPNTHHYDDIFQFSAAQFRGHVDIISGGFPCQPFSQAGKRKGKADDRYLFPEACRIITEARPEWIVLENVAGLFSILEPDSLSEMEIKAVELFCQDGDHGADSTIIRLQRRVIGSIISEIGAAGYVLPQLKDGTPVVLCIPAAALNAPHQRDRVWFVAHADGDRDQQHRDYDRPGQTGPRTGRPQERQGNRRAGIPDGFSDLLHATGTIDTISTGTGKYASLHIGSPDPHPAHSGTDWQHTVPGWEAWPAEPPFCGGNDGLPAELDGITFSAWRGESVKAYGNAIVPQVALEIFRAIQAVNRQL
ncbi:DNA (cytosine-5)-methyltransferase 1 [Arcticibacter tournemirensis]|uniref:DNA (cytosine-5-)-methyltransferase n=1 Tax=Arcticibacter tournemirensis TaxID=699437 RepID=A0A5M9GSK9_9SPHI|nr:DNA cytosine methyltransferase [Arcticibacter tournemirensis]KAA8476859.1 DNA (cytosine-5-)-methyltransferase [Arcticibacter tournemirensis]TQM49569.1 DNA (cytosine-5)-methyltransferase 1 [Arcticibacter tournemirensis]